MDVQTIDWQAMAVGDRQAMAQLHHRVWPVCGGEDPKFASRPPVDVDWPDAQREQVHVVRHRGVIIAVAQSRPRRVHTPDGPRDVLALVGVACAPQHRGRGYGAAVVRAAFQRVDRGEFPVSFFQTGVPAFYRKLGCRTVDNPLLNSHSTVDPGLRPIWEDHAMIYPIDAHWPEGPIDLLGPGW